MINQELASVNTAIAKEKAIIENCTLLIATNTMSKVVELTMNIAYNKLQELKNAFKTVQEQYHKQRERVSHIFSQRLDALNKIEKLKQAEFHLKNQLLNDVNSDDIIHRLTIVRADIESQKSIKKELNYILTMDKDFYEAHNTFQPMHEELERATMVYEIAEKEQSLQKARLNHIYELRASASRELSALEENKRFLNKKLIV
jgi:hypothetical protein